MFDECVYGKVMQQCSIASVDMSLLENFHRNLNLKMKNVKRQMGHHYDYCWQSRILEQLEVKGLEQNDPIDPIDHKKVVGRVEWTESGQVIDWCVHLIEDY